MIIRHKFKYASYAYVLILSIIAIVVAIFVWYRFIYIDSNVDENTRLRQRPSIDYSPSATPKQRAVRPVLPIKNTQLPISDNEEQKVDEKLESETLDDAANEEIVDIEESSFVISDDDPAILAMGQEADFTEAVWEALQYSDDVLQPEILSLMASDHPSDRAFGGVLLFATGALEGDALEAVIEDADSSVPLAVYDWVRDFGTDEEIEIFSDAIKSRDMSNEELFSYIQNSASLSSGGRAALDLWLSSFEDGEIPSEQLASIIASDGVSYDVRSQALFKLLEPETKAQGLAALEKYASNLNAESGEFLPHAIEKWRELSTISNSDGDEEKIWDSEAAVVLYLTESGKGLVARDLANYLEYALRRDDPDCEPTIELGTWEFANDYLQAAIQQPEAFSKIELDALDRIAVSLDRLVAYDPAFNPFEEVGENEEVPEEFFEEEVEEDTDDEEAEDIDELVDDSEEVEAEDGESTDEANIGEEADDSEEVESEADENTNEDEEIVYEEEELPVEE